jgi:choline/glycine/proline betaine transport protein
MSDWKKELAELLAATSEDGGPSRPAQRRVRSFLHEVAVPAFEEVARELQEHDRDVEVEHGDRSASIRILHDGEEEFFYEVKVKAYRKREFSFPVIPLRDAEGRTYRAEAGLKDRPLHQDVTDCTKEDLIRNLLREYSRHLKWYL